VRHRRERYGVDVLVGQVCSVWLAVSAPVRYPRAQAGVPRVLGDVLRLVRPDVLRRPVSLVVVDRPIESVVDWPAPVRAAVEQCMQLQGTWAGRLVYVPGSWSGAACVG
jgi:hypothetical protein